MQTITEWLQALPHVISATPVRVTIKGKKYDGARYVSRLATSEGSGAYSRGERSYTRESIHLAGTLPRHYVRRSKAVYTMPNDTREWYIASYWEGEANKFHPFGPYFMLAPWDVPNGDKIDQYERKPYDRVALQIEEG